jgi:FAD/FMN-containing dehydrogenase
MLWTHHLNSTVYKPTFKPAGCSTSYKAMTVGAGAAFKAIYELAEANDVTVVGGLSETVALSGGYLGGGHSVYSNTLGLAVDNLVRILSVRSFDAHHPQLETKVVTPDGQYRTASRCQNKDLFFAVAGGSPGTFGVVMESTFRVHPKITPSVVQIAFVAPNASAVDAFSDLLVDNSLGCVHD